MKLTTQDTANLLSILSTCSIGGIESIIIEDGVARGINEARTYILITTDSDIPRFPQKIGLSRLSSLRQRLELFTGNSGTVIEAKESERGEISSLEISAGRNKVQFRCTSTMLIKAPKNVNDDPIFKVFVSRDELKMILNAVKVMGGKTVQLIIKKDRSAQFILSDSTNDVFTIALETPIELWPNVEEQDSVVHYHHADIFHSVMRAIPDADITAFTVGVQGTIRTKIHGHSITVMPKINEDSEEEE